MNKINLIGRLTKDATLSYNNSNIAYTRFTLAVNRNFTNANGEREADFISCIAWRKTAELICQYFKKGSELGASGRIQTGSYDKEDGTKVYTTDVVIEEITFIGGKKDEKAAPSNPKPSDFENKTSSEIVADVMNDVYADFGEQVSIDDNFLD